MARNKPGFVLITTLFFLFLAAALVARLIIQVHAHRIVIAQAAKREQARQIAMDGIALIENVLAYDTNDAEIKKERLTWLLSNLNRWVKVELPAPAESELNFYLSCENGKINLNALYDQENKKFTNLTEEPHKILFERIRTIIPENTFIEKLGQELKKREDPLTDISDLFEGSLGSLQKTVLFEQLPFAQNESTAAFSAPLADIFTIGQVGGNITLNPFFLSRSMQKALELREMPSEKKERAKIIDALVAQNAQWDKSWQLVWDKIMAPVVGKTVQQLPKEIVKIFDGASRALNISVLCYGKVGGVTQRVSALLYMHLDDKKQARTLVRKVYWIS